MKHLAQVLNTQGILYMNVSVLSGLCWGTLCLFFVHIGPWHSSKAFCHSSPVGLNCGSGLQYLESSEVFGVCLWGKGLGISTF